MLNRLTVSALVKTVILATAFCRRGRLLAQRLGLLEPPADGKPDLCDRGCLREPVQGDAQSAHRPLDHRRGCSTPTRRSTRRSRNICAASATPKCRRWPMRLAILGALDFPQQKTLVRELDRLFKTLGGQQKEFWEMMGKAKASAPRRTAQGIHRHRQRAARRHGQAVGDARRHRQPPGRHHRPAAGDQADRLAVAQHRRRSLACGLGRAFVRQGLAGSQARLHEIRRRHRDRLERAGIDHRGHAAAAGAVKRDGRHEDRLFRAAIRPAARSPDQRAGYGRKARADRQPVDPAHRGPPRRCRCSRRSARSMPPRIIRPRSTPPPATR